MQRTLLQISAIALSMIVLMTAASYGQSLGDVAREKRSKDASTAPPKVITNQDLQKDPDANQEPSEAPPSASAAANSKSGDRRSAKHSADERLAEQRLAQERAAEQWNRQILEQKDKVASLQARVDQLRASIRSVSGSAQSEGPYLHQVWRLERLAEVQQQLDEQKRKLDRMQEAARHAGMHTAVYDP